MLVQLYEVVTSDEENILIMLREDDALRVCLLGFDGDRSHKSFMRDYQWVDYAVYCPSEVILETDQQVTYWTTVAEEEVSNYVEFMLLLS